ncbi:hypothetical protein MASR2M78_22490 [Treponema sp.]
MGKRIYFAVFFISLVYTVFSDSFDTTFASFFFGHLDYKTSNSNLQDNKQNKLFIAYEPNTKNPALVVRGFIYSFDNHQTIVHAYVFGPYVLSSLGLYLIDVSSAPGKFWGWKIEESIDNTSKIVKGLRFVYYADEGKRENDGINLLWNQGLNRFSIITADRSQW